MKKFLLLLLRLWGILLPSQRMLLGADAFGLLLVDSEINKTKTGDYEADPSMFVSEHFIPLIPNGKFRPPALIQQRPIPIMLSMT